jgi:hypothetical protein
MSQIVPDGFGLPPAGATVQNTWAIGHDAVLINPATALDSSYTFFDQSASKSTTYRTSVLSVLAQQRAVYIKALQLNHNLAFAANESEPVGSQLEGFNRFSFVQITILGKSEDKFTLEDLVPYSLINVQGTVTAQLKYAPIFVLPEAIEVPKGGDIQVTLLPNSGYTTAASAATNPHLPNAGFTTSNRGFDVTLKYWGAQSRPTA